MNMQQIKKLARYCKLLKISTLEQLEQFKKDYNIKTNSQLLKTLAARIIYRRRYAVSKI